ncbi:hypothetical protein UFOVP1596_20 [uncultured Caudovirales phage]|uniref:Uncharacterized protein n=1 Tax=uncultured Caudovirales phage TaxID=2100421 RepID=A0A6J5SUK0_9CAUD|nr:hypothetical protein UFOVP1596_20 [uncultured Caudovirales phage]
MKKHENIIFDINIEKLDSGYLLTDPEGKRNVEVNGEGIFRGIAHFLNESKGSKKYRLSVTEIESK